MIVLPHLNANARDIHLMNKRSIMTCFNVIVTKTFIYLKVSETIHIAEKTHKAVCSNDYETTLYYSKESSGDGSSSLVGVLALDPISRTSGVILTGSCFMTKFI